MTPPALMVICAYTGQRWDVTLAAVASVLNQQPPPQELILVVDHNPELGARFIETPPGVHVVPNHNTRGVSG